MTDNFDYGDNLPPAEEKKKSAAASKFSFH